MNDYIINVPYDVHGKTEFFSGQNISGMLLKDVVTCSRRTWFCGVGNDHHFRVTCTEDELIVLKLKGCTVVMNLTETHKRHLEEAKITGLAKLTDLEKEALGLK
jgi:hypothetical protein